MPNEESLKILKFRIKNLVNEERRIKFIVYIKPVLGEDEIFTNGNLKLENNNNTLLLKNIFSSEECFKNKIMYVMPDIKINSYTGNKQNFFGEGDILNPDSLYRNLDNSMGLGKNSCIGIEFILKLKKFEDKRFSIIIGQANNIEEINKIQDKYRPQNENNMIIIDNELEQTKSKWNNLLGSVNVKTPIQALNIMMNGWLAYQTLSSRIYGKTGYYQSGGAFGFRDQLQDAIRNEIYR